MKRTAQIAMFLLWLLLALSLGALAQDGGERQLNVALGDPFAALSQRLDAAAEAALSATSSQFSPQAPSDPQRVEPGQRRADEVAIGQFATQYWKGQTRDFGRALARVERLRPVLEPVLQEVGVPTELAAVVLIESGGDAWARSPRGARGLWQFIPETARRYGLHVSEQHDDRLDVSKSTRAAAQYLRDLRLRFQDWRLVLAAYNAGEGAVQEAVSRGGTSDFSALSNKRLLPEETRNYVPAVLAATELLDSSGGLTLPATEAPSREARVVYALMSVE